MQHLREMGRRLKRSPSVISREFSRNMTRGDYIAIAAEAKAVRGNCASSTEYLFNPSSSCQRGTNENTNGLLRRYLPKKTSFQNLTQEDLDDMVWEINSRPKKCLDYDTPQEVFINYNSERRS